MAITITNANSNISDTTLSYTLTFTGDVGDKVLGQILVNGVSIGSAETTGSSVVVSFTAANLYAAAQGSSLSGAVTFRVTDLTIDDIPIGSSSKTGGNITINARVTGLTLTEPNTIGSRTWNMDSSTGNTLTASWTRPHTAFYARLKGYVNGTLVINRYGFTTSSNFDVVSLGYQTAIINAMAGASPADFRLDVITQFDDGTADYIDLSYTPVEGTNRRSTADSITKTFVTLSTIAINNFELSSSTTTVPFTLTTYGSYTHTVRLYVKVNGVDTLIRTETGITTSGNFTIGATERNLILNAMPASTVATTWAEVDTSTYGTTNSQAVATTVTLHADYKPAFGTIAWAESTGTTYVKTALGYGTGEAVFLTNKSKVTFTVPTTMATGATLSNIRVVFAGTTTDSATSPVTTGFLATAGATSSYTITATDSRGRSTVVTNGSIKVRAYTYPIKNKFEIYRTTDGSSTTYDPLGTYLRVTYAATAYSVLNATGAEKNWCRLRIDTRVLNTDPYVNKVNITTSLLTVDEASANISGYLATNAYDVRIRIYDAFYDLDNNAFALEDTDDFVEVVLQLPVGKVALDVGPDNVGIGKLWAQGTLDVGGDIYMNGTKVSVNGHTHNYAGSVSAGGAANSAIGLSISGYGNGDAGTMITGYQSSAPFQSWTDNWASHLILNHGDGSTYFNNVMTFPFWGPPHYMRKENGVNKGPWVFWTAESLPITTGTFTPTVTGTTTAGVGTYTTKKGYYTRIGNVVHFKIDLSWSAHTGTGNMTVTGLPFTADANGRPAIFVYASSLTLTGTGYNVEGYIEEGGTRIIITQFQSTTGAGAVAMDTSATLLITGTYWV